MYLLKKEDLEGFFDSLPHQVIAPVKKKSIHVFEEVDDFSQVDLDMINTHYPAKDVFLPEETMFSYSKDFAKQEIDDKKRIIFGIRPCDVHALQKIDRIFLGDYVDPYYNARRENTMLIVFKCTEAGDDCFCGSFGTYELDDGYDLMFTETDEGYVVRVGSEKGEELINHNFEETDSEPEIELKFKKSLSDKNLMEHWDSEVWKKQAEMCLSCGACTISCPTCGCFFISDEPELDLESGKRYRFCASCQLKNFTRVAGDCFFREDRTARLRHRIFHQLVYFKEKFDEQMCVGCGRCFTNCPTEIDMVKIVDEL